MLVSAYAFSIDSKLNQYNVTLDLENINEFNCNVINNLFFQEEILMMMAPAIGHIASNVRRYNKSHNKH